jgi:glycosyltransferase involved in cell wall biosynthesis
MSGILTWRKAPDIFILLAGAVNKRSNEPVHFVWVGGSNIGGITAELAHDVGRMNLNNVMHFMGEKSDPFDYFQACDIFALISREEAFGRVGLEAAFLGKPIVCFFGAGGMREFVGDECGVVVPYLDIETMAEKIIAFIDDPGLRHKTGMAAREKALRNHDVHVQAPKIQAIIRHTMGAQP